MEKFSVSATVTRAELGGRGSQLKPWAKVCDGGVQEIKRAPDPFGKLAGKSVRENTLIAAVEECCAELALEFFQGLCGGRLRDVAGTGGLGDRAGFHDHYEETQMTKIILNRQHGVRIYALPSAFNTSSISSVWIGRSPKSCCQRAVLVAMWFGRPSSSTMEAASTISAARRRPWMVIRFIV
jgi:hypothetical protein